MKKIITHSVIRRVLAFLLTCCFSFAHAQNNCQPCELTIVGDFESSCILPLQKPSFIDEYPDALIACQGNTVLYRAVANTGNIPITNWQWSIQGESSYVDHHNGTVSVTWGMGQSGQIAVTITTATTASCSSSKMVLLIEKPVINAYSIPAYTEENGAKYIYVCKSQSVEFIDQSHTTNSDIAGYSWHSDYHGSASTQNFTIENVTQADKVTHRVYNNCGCYDEEIYLIKMLDGEPLKLSCYGTVCEDAIVSYTAQSPACSQYFWYVDGGTILGGQHTQTVTVQWDNPQNGYGIIGLDGSLCDKYACPNLLSKKIPIIQDHLAIEGQTLACVGEAVIYSLPVFGSTEYSWTITPSAGVTIDPYNGGNQILLRFNQSGSWQISANYHCEFLGCGEYHSDTITVTVKPNLYIVGEKRICTSQSCNLTTEPLDVATWNVYAMDNNDQLVATASNISQFVHQFSTPGKYLVTAENPSYCKPATFALTVSPAPPAPTINEMNPDNPHTACLESSILLKAQPQNPNYNIVWEPACTTALPQHVAGNEVTITYDNEVCNVAAYTYDRSLNCLSENAYIHVVNQFQLANVTLPTDIFVCPGSEIQWTSANVPYQEEVLYKWILQDNKQYCASIQGNPLSNAITLQINEIPSGNDDFTITLERKYCTNLVENRVVNIHIRTTRPGIPDFNNNPPVCQFDEKILQGANGTSGHYYWSIGNSSYLYHFDNLSLDTRIPGSVDVTLCLNNFDVCSNPAYYNCTTKTVIVNPIPPAECLRINAQSSTIEVYPPLSPAAYTFDWSENGVAAGSGNSILYHQGAYYECIVSDIATGCKKTIVECENCEDMEPFTYDFNYCTHELTCTVPNAPGNVIWSVDPPHNDEIAYSGNPEGSIAVIPFRDVGHYIVTAYVPGDPCFTHGEDVVIDCLPSISFEKNCSEIVIHNDTRYLNPNTMLHFSIEKDGAYEDEIDIPAISPTIPYPTSSGSYHFTLEYFSVNGNDYPVNCTYGPVEITNSSDAALSIVTENVYDQHWTCENIPIKLTAMLAPSYSIHKTQWFFGDNSSLTRNSNYIYHTYAMGNNYNLVVSVYDVNGCFFKDSIQISSFGNEIIDHQRIKRDPNSPICPNSSPVQLNYVHDPNVIPYPAQYYWHSPNGFLTDYYTDHTGDYYALVQNNYFCKGQAMSNVPFKNAPTAIIIPESYNVCLGEEISIWGSPDPNPTGYTFFWTITDSATGNPVTVLPDPTIHFAPTTEGVYFVDLTITNSEGCSDDASTVRIVVHPTPPAPSIAFNGNECIDNPPVDLKASTTTPAADFHWSNGDHGSTAEYYYPGIATVYYYDPASGCKSHIADTVIQPEPNFDALLTGCYKKCPKFFPNALQTWGMTYNGQSYYWKWIFENSGIAGGTSSSTHMYFPLPNPGYGSYFLDMDYQLGSNCTVTSPLLTIEPKDTCDCENLDISVSGYKMDVINCELQYSIMFKICNTGYDSACVSKIELLTNNNITLDFAPTTSTTVYPGGCVYINVGITVSGFSPTSALFQLVDDCNKCTKKFSFDILPTIDCTEKMELKKLECVQNLTNDAATYYFFQFDLPSTQQVLAFWTEPPIIINYASTISGSTATVYGLGMLDNALLSELIANNQDICFHAITCMNNVICKREYCIPAKYFAKLCGKDRNSDSTDEKATKTIDNLGNDFSPQLVPNPTTGEVNVNGTNDEVVEVLVMDMNGRKMATFDNTSNFNISTLSSGIYIVRVKTHHDNTDKVTYLKLVKK